MKKIYSFVFENGHKIDIKAICFEDAEKEINNIGKRLKYTDKAILVSIERNKEK